MHKHKHSDALDINCVWKEYQYLLIYIYHSLPRYSPLMLSILGIICEIAQLNGLKKFDDNT